MKTNEELNAIKEKVKSVNKKLAELTEEELEQVAGGRPRTVEVDSIVAPDPIETNIIRLIE